MILSTGFCHGDLEEITIVRCASLYVCMSVLYVTVIYIVCLMTNAPQKTITKFVEMHRKWTIITQFWACETSTFVSRTSPHPRSQRRSCSFTFSTFTDHETLRII